MEMLKLVRYEILAEIGKGAMGTVYKAADPLLNRTVAIKTINVSASKDEMAVYEARFYQEAKAVGGLNHPNIVTVYDIGKSGNTPYLAMELLEGTELRMLTAAGNPLPVGQAVDIAAQVAEGLAYAHKHEVVHRDIKPANIMIVGDGLVKITDFGIARMRVAEVRTQAGAVLGSPRYMSPEQVLGKRAEARSDIFSLGVILYEMLTGKAPFPGADLNAIMFQIVNLVPPMPSLVNPAVPTMLDFIVVKALAKVPDERYASAGELAADLRECAKQTKLALPEPAAGTGSSQSVLPTIDPYAATPLLVQSYPHARRSDVDPAMPDLAATNGLSKTFDSLAATVRLAAHTGMTEELDEYVKTHGGGDASIAEAASGKNPPRDLTVFGLRREGWSKSDKILFMSSVAAAALVAVVIVVA
jgi:serine/threonine protein kinase